MQPAADSAALGSALQARLLALVRALRVAGVPVSISEDLDALSATGTLDLLDRGQLREALAATTVKSPGHRAAFDTLFEVFFPPRVGVSPTAEDSSADRTPPPFTEARDIGDFLADLVARLLEGDDAALRRMALEAVASYGGVANRDGSTSWFAYRVFRHFNLGGILRRALAESGDDDAAPLSRRLTRDDLERRLQRFREDIEAELRRRLVAQRGVDEVAATLVRPLPEDVDFFQIGHDEQAAMRRAVRPLARRLASRLAVKRRRGRAGRLDVRRTIRSSLSVGGVPVDPRFRAKRAHRPELVLLCDVSGSVSAFARFTLMFCHALQGQFSRVRSFAFIDTVDEVTRLFEAGDFSDAMTRLSHEAQVVWLDGHSDYGHAFEGFHDRYLDAVTPRTTVLVLGDARNNYRAVQARALREVRRRARRVYWLNPEPSTQWDTGDSVAGDYAAVIDGMVECRSLRQLSDFVETLA